MTMVHVRNGFQEFEARFLDLPIVPSAPSSIPSPKYVYFLLHKLIGDIVWMAGGAETLGEDEFLDNDDPWTESHLVSPFSLPFMDEKLEHLQGASVRGGTLNGFCSG
jgi:hypothetical protein